MLFQDKLNSYKASRKISASEGEGSLMLARSVQDGSIDTILPAAVTKD